MAKTVHFCTMDFLVLSDRVCRVDHNYIRILSCTPIIKSPEGIKVWNFQVDNRVDMYM